MAITMNGVAQMQKSDNKHFDIYNDVGEDEDGDVDPLSQRHRDKPTRPEMVWGVRHSGEYITIAAICPEKPSPERILP